MKGFVIYTGRHAATVHNGIKVYQWQNETRWTDNHVSAPCCCFGRLWKLNCIFFW